MKHFATAVALIAIVTPALAQEAALARGKIVDATTGKPVPGATVFNKATGESAIADDAGNFEFLASDGPADLVVIDPSYKKAEARYDGKSAVTITLEPVSVRGEEIVIEAERERTTAGETTMRREEIARVPGSRGDALSAVKNLPGVANTQGFGPNAGLVIRGSSPADSRIFVDGFEIPILYHLGGIQSVLPTEMIDDLVYTPGAFGVELGRASAGTIQVASRRGARSSTPRRCCRARSASVAASRSRRAAPTSTRSSRSSSPTTRCRSRRCRATTTTRRGSTTRSPIT
jgi:hypothetical protein